MGPILYYFIESVTSLSAFAFFSNREICSLRNTHSNVRNGKTKSKAKQGPVDMMV